VTNKFWENKKVLITGHTGFTGGWLSQILILNKSKVFGISLKSKNKNYLFELSNLKKKMKSYIFDINNYKKLKKTIQFIKPEIIFHLAAQPIVKEGYTSPLKTFNTNINGTINILQIARSVKSIKSLLVVTSDKCYENNNKKIFFSENFNLGGDDPYSASKSSQEIITNSYYKSFFKDKVGVSTARAGNIIGGADWAKDRLVVDIMYSIFKKKPLSIRNLNSIRPWQHVLDVISGYMLLASKMYSNPKKYSSAWNFGPNVKKNTEFLKVKSVITIFSQLLKLKIKFKSIKPKYREKKFLFLNSNKSIKLLGWKKKIDLKNSIKLTLEWYSFFYNNKKKNIQKFTEGQIINYFKI